MTIMRRAGVLLLCFLTAGCGFFSRTKNQYYSLETIAPAAGPAAVGGSPIGVDGVELPPGFDRRGIVARGAGHRVEIRGSHLWASPLEEMVIHTLAFDLAERMPQGMVVLPAQAKPSGPMRSLYVTFEDLAPGPDRVFVLDARWTLTTTGATQLAGRERITIDLSSLDSAQIAAGMSQALAALADRIVAGIGRG